MNLIEQLQKEKESLQKRIDAINILLDSYGKNTEESVGQSRKSNYDKFPNNRKFLDQIIYVIKAENRFIHTSEIVDIIKPYHLDKSSNWLRTRVSSVLSTAKSRGEIPNLISINYSKSKKDTVWGSRDWCDSSGDIIEKFMYKPKSENQVEKPSL